MSRLLWPWLSFFLAASIIALFAGFFLFLHHVPIKNPQYPSYTLDAAVVFTGHHSRLKAGFSLLHSQRVQKLFITGVEPSLSIFQVISASQTLYPPSQTDISCCIFLDKSATNTIQNVQQTLAWAEQNKVGEIVLVTSDYHVPRSLFIAKILKSPLKIYTFPIKNSLFSPNQELNTNVALTLIQEYGKILITIPSLLFLQP
jgi:uncharacterized SAM-binding protein YcdF (DUF218 family)